MSNYAKEAPYHPGYEDAVFQAAPNKLLVELNEYRRMNEKYASLSTTIVEYIKTQKSTK